MSDLIDRQAAINRFCELLDTTEGNPVTCIRQVLDDLPPAQPEPKEIGYTDCADAMMKMWIDKVLTDGEYSRIMDKLNAHWAERREDD